MGFSFTTASSRCIGTFASTSSRSTYSLLLGWTVDRAISLVLLEVEWTSALLHALRSICTESRELSGR